MKSDFYDLIQTKLFKTTIIVIGLCIVQWMTPFSISAHVFWVEPENYHPKVGDFVQISLRVGENFKGETRPYIDDWFTKFSVADPDEENSVIGELGDDPAGIIKIRRAGVHVISFHGTPGYVKLEPKKFHTYLRKWGLERIIKMREDAGELDKKVNEAFSRCAKALVNVDSKTVNVGFDQDLKCTLELIPEKNPYQTNPGDTITFRLLYKGDPLEGALMIGITRDLPEKQIKVRTDRNGRASIVLPRKGEWLFNSVHMIRSSPGQLSDEGEKVDWHSYWASLVFKMK